MCIKKDTLILIIKKKIKVKFEVEENAISVFLNPYSYLKIRRDKSVLNYVDNIYVDGIALIKILKIFKINNVKRYSFDYTSIAELVFKKGRDEKKKIAIIGSTKENVYSFTEHLKMKYEGINVTYFHEGFFEDEEEKIKVINNTLKADIVICGMGTPLQEKFMKDLRINGFTGSGYTCGGFIHQTASTGGEYYPKIFNRLNIRFIYRMYDEPKLIKRYLMDYPLFLIYFLKDYYTDKIKHK